MRYIFYCLIFSFSLKAVDQPEFSAFLTADDEHWQEAFVQEMTDMYTDLFSPALSKTDDNQSTVTLSENPVSNNDQQVTLKLQQSLNQEPLSDELIRSLEVSASPEILSLINTLKNENIKPYWPHFVMLVGEPGVGKSTTAKFVAHKLDWSYFFVKGAGIATEYQHSGAQNVDRMFTEIFEFAQSHDKPCILIFDEINALTGKVLTSIGQLFDRGLQYGRNYAKYIPGTQNVPLATAVVSQTGTEYKIAESAAENFVQMESLKPIESSLKQLLPTAAELTPTLEKAHEIIGLSAVIKKLDNLYQNCAVSLEKLGDIAVKFDFEHAFGLEIYDNVKKGISKLKLNGFHHDYLGQLQKAGIVKFENIRQGIGGCFKADVIINGVLFEGKTFFPAHWAYEMIAKKAIEGLKNAVLKESSLTRCAFEGITKDGIKIFYVIDNPTKVIRTFYPIV